MSPLPTLSEHLKDINNLLYQFLWDGKQDKIKRAEMINDYATGRLDVGHLNFQPRPESEMDSDVLGLK